MNIKQNLEYKINEKAMENLNFVTFHTTETEN